MTSKSAVKAATRTAARPFENAEDPGRIRNVALVGHSGAGKTTLAEALLAHAGILERAGSVVEGTTVTDSDPIEVALQHSIALSLAPLPWQETVINLLDTPGSLDFSGELRAGLRAADAALFVVSAAADIDPVSLALWEECAAAGTPRAIVVDRHECSPAEVDAAMENAGRVFGADGSDVRALHLPPGSLAFGGEEASHTALIEAIIERSEDETLMERYLAGESIDEPVLMADLGTAVRRGHFFPIMAVDTATGIGLGDLLDCVVRGFPSPADRAVDLVGGPAAYTATRPDGTGDLALTCDPSGPLVAEVVRTSVDPYLGRLSIIRLFSGTLAADTALHVSGHADRFAGSETGHPEHDADERVAGLFSPLGALLRPVTSVVAGDLCAISRLAAAETGDTISAKSDPWLVAPWPAPDPLLPIAVKAPTRSDEDALAKALGRLAAADPTVRVDRRETGQLVLWCLGEGHADVVLQRLRRFGAQVQTEDVITPLRETFAGAARGHGRQVKQSGGHGQYAVCDVEITPLPRGAGVEFAEKVVGGAVPHQFIGSVEKGVRAQLLAGLDDRKVPVTDVLVTLVDGKAHSVDSSDAAFQTSGALAVRDAAATAGLVLLEPIAHVEVTVPDAYVGAVMSDLSGRRGRVSGTAPDPTAPPGMERTLVSAEVPEAELVRYPITLRGLSAGSGRFTRAYSRHDVLPTR